MSDNMWVNIIVWTVFAISLLIIIPFAMKRVRSNKKNKAKAEEIFQQDRVTYSHLTKENTAELTGEKLVEAVIYQCMRKEDEDDDFFDSLNEAERTLYAIYQVNETVSASSGLKSFFMSPATKKYVPDIEKYYLNIGAHEVAEVLRNAKILNEILETNDESLEKDMNPEFMSYNFSDFNHEYVTLVVGTNFTTKMGQYADAHKEEFLENDTEGENNEGLSE